MLEGGIVEYLSCNFGAVQDLFVLLLLSLLLDPLPHNKVQVFRHHAFLHERLVSHWLQLRSSDVFDLIHQRLQIRAEGVFACLSDGQVQDLVFDYDLAVAFVVASVEESVSLGRLKPEEVQKLEPNALEAVGVLLKQSEVLANVRDHFFVELHCPLVGVRSSGVGEAYVGEPVLRGAAFLYLGVNAVGLPYFVLENVVLGLNIGVEELFFAVEIFRVFDQPVFYSLHDLRDLRAEQILQISRVEAVPAVVQGHEQGNIIILEGLLRLRVVNMNEHVAELFGELLAAAAELLELSVG